MIHIIPTITTDSSTRDRDLESHSVEDSPSPERDHMSRSTHNALRKRDGSDMPLFPAHSLETVLAVKPDTLAQHEPDASPLRILGESGVEGFSVEPTVDKPLSGDRLDPPSEELSEPTKVDDEYVDWREAIDPSHIRCASLKRRIKAVLEKHDGMYNRTLSTIKATEHRIYLPPEAKQIRKQPYRTGPKSREVLEQNMQTMFDDGIRKPAQTE